MPDTKFGKCPWCERHEQRLYFSIGSYDRKLWCDYICMQCLNTARKFLELPEDGRGD